MEQTTRIKSMNWWNSLGKIKQDDLALDYFGSTLMMDSEIEQIWLREVPPVKMYSKEEVFALITTYNNANTESPNVLKFIEENL